MLCSIHSPADMPDFLAITPVVTISTATLSTDEAGFCALFLGLGLEGSITVGVAIADSSTVSEGAASGTPYRS